MDNFSAYLLGLLAMMAIEWPFSLLPLLIMAHLRQTKEEAPWKKPTHQHLNVRSRKKNKCHHTAEQPKPQSPAHTKIVIVSNNNGRHCDPSIPSTYSILLLFFHSLFHCSAEKKTTLEPNCSDFHRHLYMQRYLYPSLQPFSLARSPAIGCL